MPSSRKTVLKDLYQANSVEELNKLAEISKEKSANLNLMCKSADKVFLKAQDFDLLHDEEMAYIFFMRYFNIITQIKKSPKYKKEKAFIDKLLGETKPKKAINRAEKLQESLVTRYEERQKMKEDEELAKKLLARDAKREKENQPRDTRKQDKTSSLDDDLDSFLDGLAILSPSDICQKLKVNHSSILTPEGSRLSNGLHDPNTLIPDLSKATPFLTAEQLYSLTKTVPPSDILILDIRPMKEYANNHILHDASINIPAEYLEHGVSVSNIDRRIPERTRLVWCQRGTRNHVIVLDKCSRVKDISPASKLFQFKEAIFRDDSSCTLLSEPLFLDGGFDDWLWHYPSLAAKPELPSISSNSKLNEFIDVASLDFPEIPEEKKTVPTPPPVETQTNPSAKKSEISEQNDLHPRAPLGKDGTSKDRPGVILQESQSEVSGHPKVPTSLPQIPGHSEVPESDGHPTVAKQPQVSGHPTTPTSLGYQTVPSQPQVPGQPTTQRPVLGHPTVPTSQPGVPDIKNPLKMDVVSDHPSEDRPEQTMQESQSGVPGHPMVPASQPSLVISKGSVSQNEVPGHPTIPISQNQPPTSRNPPLFSSGQNVIPGQREPTSVLQPTGIQRNEYMTSPGLPLGWEKCHDSLTNRVFYKDHNTHTTHWNVPNVKPQGPGTPKQQTMPTPLQPATSQHTPIQQQSSKPSQVPTQMSQPQPQILKQQTAQQQPRSSVPGQAPPQPSQPQIPKQQQQKLQPSTPKQEPTQSYQGEVPPAGQAGKLKSGLRRSLSSPNLAKLDDEEPRVDRSQKPVEPAEPVIKRPAFNRNTKPITTYKIESLNPVHGGIGCGLTGLRNLGNTCYMNSVLQCLFSAAPLSAYFISGAFRDDLNAKNPMGTRGELAQQFSMLVRVTNSGHYKSISPTDFKKTIGKIKPAFAGYDQQDSQEFLTLMMDKLHEDVNKVTKKPYFPAPEDDLDPSVAAELAWTNHKKRNESLMLQLFDGLFMSTVRCLTCNKKSVTFETFSNLTLPLPAHRGHCSLKDCLELFIRPEKMSGNDKWFCPKCKLHREAVKQLQIWRLPPILIVHLKRFQYDGMWRQKLQTSVSYPLRDLDMSSYVIGPKSSSYNLFSVSNHYGTMHGGHYTAFCVNSHDRKWYKFDDQLVSQISNPNSVVTSAGYLLFYTSMSFTPPKPFYQ